MEKGEAIEEHVKQNWSEAVEDLVTAGDTDAAISLLETVVSHLETLTQSETVNLQLASSLRELSKLFSSKNFSLKSDQLLSRATLFEQRALHCRPFRVEDGTKDLAEDEVSQPTADLCRNDSVAVGSCVDDWEAIADCAPDELITSPALPNVSKLSLQDTTTQGLRRRGRGTFSYKKEKLYSDRQFDMSSTEDEEVCSSAHVQQNAESIHCKYGTQHVLVLADFPPSTRTIDLEKLFIDFANRIVIRWVSDTMALAVFQTPSIALEAWNKVRCPFAVRILDENDILLSSIPEKDLEPPRRRPQTSARTAQRLIAQGIGLKLPSTFGSKELENQEAARKNRITTRQKMIEDAWGDNEK